MEMIARTADAATVQYQGHRSCQSPVSTCKDERNGDTRKEERKTKEQEFCNHALLPRS